MSEEEDGPLCPYCTGHSDREFLESHGRFIAAVEAQHRLDLDAFKTLVDGVTPLDYHSAVELFVELLNETGKHGFDPVSTLEAMRARCNAYLAAE